ncbi:MAG: T9SS type A sorting domain-containing protein [Fluviicola sp.]|nr:T9SS type A sorting domain-containing protein [Fluviicola sp.]
MRLHSLNIFIVTTLLVFTNNSFGQIGSTCANPEIITSAGLPITQIGKTTAGFGDDYSSLSACSSNYMNGDDYVYRYTPSYNDVVNITISNLSSWVGLFVTQGCPDVGTCVASNTTSGSGPLSLTGVALTAGVDYYIIISTWPSPQTTTFDFDMTGTPPPTCNDPSSLSAINLTPSSADLGWIENGTASTWDIELGIGGFVPTGTPTLNDALNNPTTYTGLAPLTNYDYYVRSDCGGLVSSWVGPFNFNTIACNIQSPSGLNATNISSTTADLGWTENGNASLWDIELGVSGFAPTGTPTVGNASSNPTTYNGLTALTSYDFYVRSKCGGANSIWVGPFTFTTTSVPNNFTSEMINGWDRGVIQDPSGNYIWAGHATNNSSDFQVVKTDQSGGVIWSKTIGESGSESAYDIVNSGDGGYVMVGHTNSASLISNGGYDIMVTKLNAMGAHVWTRVIGTSSSEFSSQSSIIRNPDGTYSIAAVSNSDMLFIQLSATGVVLKNKILNTQSAWGYAVTKASGTNNGWAVAGRYQGPFGSEYMITKIREDGTYDWSMIWGDGTGTGEVLYAIIENGPNDYTVFGYTYAEGTNPSNMYATRFTNSGAGPTVAWIKAYGKTNVGCRINDATLASDGNYVITGSCGAAGAGGYSDTYLVKINPVNGAIIWQTEKPDDMAGNRQGDGVIEESSGSFLVAGLGGFDMLKFAPDGTICDGIPGTLITEDLGSTLPNYDSTEGQSINTFSSTDIARTPTISNFGTLLEGCNVVPLPIELSYFDVFCEENNLLFKWQTDSEINNDYFTIEKSENGTTFEEVAIIVGAGSSVGTLNYEYKGSLPRDGKTIFRLKQTDFDGNYQYSQLRSTKCKEQIISIFPNPFSEKIEIKVNYKLKDDFIVELTNQAGQIVFSSTLLKNSFGIELQFQKQFAKGIYFIKIYNEKEILAIKKLAKQ